MEVKVTSPDWKGYTGEGCGVDIHSTATLKEYVVVNGGSERITRIGRDCYIMSLCFIGHDAILDDGVQMAPGAKVGGFSEVGRKTFIGMNASVHQRSKIGSHCMIGANSFFKGQSPPGITWAGVPARPLKVNVVGIDRDESLDDEERKVISDVAERYLRDYR